MALLKSGKSFRSVAAKLNASLSSVVRWCQAHRKKGRNGLHAKPAWGRPPGLSQAQKRTLLRLLLKGAQAHGYSTEIWTLKRMARLIQKHFGVRYHPGHVWHLMTSLEWSCQKPERRAIERDEEAIERWKRRAWPRIKKSPTMWGPSGFPR
jgi:transposase